MYEKFAGCSGEDCRQRTCSTNSVVDVWCHLQQSWANTFTNFAVSETRSHVVQQVVMSAKLCHRRTCCTHLPVNLVNLLQVVNRFAHWSLAPTKLKKITNGWLNQSYKFSTWKKFQENELRSAEVICITNDTLTVNRSLFWIKSLLKWILICICLV